MFHLTHFWRFITRDVKGHFTQYSVLLLIWNNRFSLSSVVQNYPQVTSQIFFANLVLHDNCSGRHYSPPDTFRAVATCSYGDQDLIIAFQPYGSPSLQA